VFRKHSKRSARPESMFLALLLVGCDPCEDVRSMDPECPCYDTVYEIQWHVTCRQDQVLTVLPVGAGTTVAATSGALSDVEIEGGDRLATCICKAPASE
jgi:hypothetical protein